MEGINPARRYKWFRPRQAFRGSYVAATTTNHGTFQLYNQGAGAELLVVRAIQSGPSDLMAVTIQQGSLGTHLGTEHPLITGEALKAGQVFYVDQVAKITPDYVVTQASSFIHDFPFCVIQPGWGLVLQDTATGGTEVNASFLWEAIEADELDFLY